MHKVVTQQSPVTLRGQERFTLLTLVQNPTATRLVTLFLCKLVIIQDLEEISGRHGEISQK